MPTITAARAAEIIDSSMRPKRQLHGDFVSESDLEWKPTLEQQARAAEAAAREPTPLGPNAVRYDDRCPY